MKSTFILFGMLWMLLISACAPGKPVTETPPPSPPESPTTSHATVESVEVNILESDPPVIRVTARGYLPDAGCTSISVIEQSREGSIFLVTIDTTTDPLAICAQALTPFEEVIDLEADRLAAGQYRVIVNGVEASVDLNSGDRTSFEQRLVEALNARNYDRLATMMGDAWLVGYWQSEGVSYAPAEAIEQLRAGLIASDAPISADHDRDLVSLLGMDPAAILGPEAGEVSAVLVSGMGVEGKGEDILFIRANSESGWLWHGLLFAMDGFGR